MRHKCIHILSAMFFMMSCSIASTDVEDCIARKQHVAHPVAAPAAAPVAHPVSTPAAPLTAARFIETRVIPDIVAGRTDYAASRVAMG